MVELSAQRRLAAIVVAEVVAYSRMMEADEAGTLAALAGNTKQAEKAMTRLRQLRPGLRISNIEQMRPLRGVDHRSTEIGLARQSRRL